MDFRQNKELEKLVVSMTRQSENTVREDMEMPKVGEGWISETDLYYKIKKQYPVNSILFHASPEWLGSQHLDIYLPEMSIALEYQGKQHYEPVDFFGGEEAFNKRKELDEKKAKLCKRHGTRIIYVNEGYDISEIISEIETIRK